jgi:hypothetical protein
MIALEMKIVKEYQDLAQMAKIVPLLLAQTLQYVKINHNTAKI